MFVHHIIMEHNLKHAWWVESLQKVMRWFLDADDNPDPTET